VPKTPIVSWLNASLFLQLSVSEVTSTAYPCSTNHENTTHFTAPPRTNPPRLNSKAKLCTAPREHCPCCRTAICVFCDSAEGAGLSWPPTGTSCSFLQWRHERLPAAAVPVTSNRGSSHRIRSSRCPGGCA